MVRPSSIFYQHRADDAAEEVRASNLAGAKERFEGARIAWQGLADDARLREAAAAETAALKDRREQSRIQVGGKQVY